MRWLRGEIGLFLFLVFGLFLLIILILFPLGYIVVRPELVPFTCNLSGSRMQRKQNRTEEQRSGREIQHLNHVQTICSSAPSFHRGVDPQGIIRRIARSRTPSSTVSSLHSDSKSENYLTGSRVNQSFAGSVVRVISSYSS